MKFETARALPLDMIRTGHPSCYFFHIPKTGGMSTWQLLDWLYPQEKICPGRMWEDIIHMPMNVLDTYAAFRGHFLSYLEPFLGRKLPTFTILRDPIARTLSHYHHVRRSPEHPFHREANTLTIAEFCLHPRTRHMVQNYQANYLACSPAKNPREIAASLSSEDLAVYKLQLALDPDPDQFTSEHELERAARDRLRSFIAAGIMERLSDSLRLIARRLGAPEPPQFSRRNAGFYEPVLQEATIRIIRECTQVDRTLYDEAVKYFEHSVLVSGEDARSELAGNP